jgi:hypothetical protein
LFPTEGTNWRPRSLEGAVVSAAQSTSRLHATVPTAGDVVECDTSTMAAAILVTSVSGVGKSAALVELSQRRFDTIETGDGPWIEVVDGEPLWREPLIEELLIRPRTAPLFVQGTVANQWRFYDRFDAPCHVEL